MLDIEIDNQPHIDFEPPKIQEINRWYNRKRTPAPIKGDSVTDTSFGNDTDVNKIVDRFARTGFMPEGPSVQPVYEDVTNLQGDLTELMQKTMDAKAALDTLNQEQEAAKQKQAEADAKELEQFRAFKAQQQADSAETPPSE